MDDKIATDIVQWDLPNWGHLLDIWKPHLVSIPPKRVLELGGSGGGPSLWAAREGHSVLCTDFPDLPPRARELHKRYLTHSLISYGIVDATNIGHEEEFDVIMVKSVLTSVTRYHGTSGVDMALRSIHRALKPGGVLLFAENLPGTFMHAWSRQAFISWTRELHYLSDEQWSDKLSFFSSVQRKNFGLLGNFGRTSGLRHALGMVDQRFDSWIPATWKYVTIGVARK